MDTTLLCYGATVPGKKHLKSMQRNQDSFHIINTAKHIIGVVTDGCTSSKGYSNNNVGAQLFAPLIATHIERRLAEHEEDHTTQRFWELVEHDILADIGSIASLLPGKRSEVIKDWLLFTIVGFVVAKGQLVVFHCGDGMYVYNDTIYTLKPATGNLQPYLSYRLSSIDEMSLLPLCKITIEVSPVAQLDHIVIGTDGMYDIFDLEQKIIPMTQTSAGRLDGFWKDPRILANPMIAQNKLHAMNRKSFRVDYEKRDITHYHELMEDDTTFIVLTHSLTSKNVPS